MGDLVLVLEDDDDIRAVLCDLLGDAGYSPVSARHDGELPDVRGVSLVVTDLPKAAHGYCSGEARDWVTRIRDRYLTPVLVITAHNEAASDDALRELTAAVVTKPFEVEELLTRLRSMAATVRSDGAR